MRKRLRIITFIAVLVCTFTALGVTSFAAYNANDWRMEGDTVWSYKGTKYKLLEDDWPQNATTVVDGAFADAKRLNAITIPSYIRELGMTNLLYCDKITTIVNLSKNNQRISHRPGYDIPIRNHRVAYGYSSNIDFKNFVVNQGYQWKELPDDFSNDWVIRDGQILYYRGLAQKLSLKDWPKNISVVADGAFADAPLLSSLTIPPYIKELGMTNLLYCDNIKVIKNLSRDNQKISHRPGYDGRITDHRIAMGYSSNKEYKDFVVNQGYEWKELPF